MDRGDIMRVIMIGTLAAAVLFAGSFPAGTDVQIRLGQTISSNKAKSGDTWDGTLAKDIQVDGRTVAKQGDPVTGKVVNAKSSGRLSDPGELALQLTRINGEEVTSNSVMRKGDSHTGRNAKSAGGGAGLGAIIGGIAGGGKGAAIGAGAGAAAGTAGAAATGKKDVTIPAETKLTFTLH
jgi:hypothetical protein